jgi:hypothetical protein
MYTARRFFRGALIFTAFFAPNWRQADSLPHGAGVDEICTQWVTRGNDGWICLSWLFWVSFSLVFSMASCHGFWECGVHGTRLPTRTVQQDRKKKSLATKIRFRCFCCARVTVNWRGAGGWQGVGRQLGWLLVWMQQFAFALASTRRRSRTAARARPSKRQSFKPVGPSDHGRQGAIRN